MPPLRCKYVVISLARSHERRAHMERELEKAGVAERAEFFPATDGRELFATAEGSREARRQARGMRYVSRYSMTHNDFAAFISHREIWRKLVLDEENDWYVVLEDNAALCPQMDEIAASLIAQRDGEFIWLYLGRDVDSLAARVRPLPGGHDLVAEYGPHPQAKVFGPGRVPTSRILRGWLLGCKGYLLSKQAAEKLLAANPLVLRSIHRQMCRFWESGLAPLAVHPNAVGLTQEFPTTTGERQDLHVVPRFAEYDPRRWLARVLFAVLRRRDALRYRRAVAALIQRYGPPDTALTRNRVQLPGANYDVLPAPWQEQL